MLILLYTKDELSFDRFQQNSKQLFRVTCEVIDKQNDRDTKYGLAAAVQGPAFKKEIPEVEDFVRIYENNFVIKSGAESFDQAATWVDENFFRVFSFPLLYGDAGKVLSDRHSLVLTDETAKKYFGIVNAVGKTLELEINKHFESFVVSGIAKRPPENSSIKFDLLLPFSYYASLSKNDNGEWQLLNYSTYLFIHPAADLQAVSSKMNRVYKSYAAQLLTEDNKQGITLKFIWGLQPFLQMHLDTNVINEGSIKDESQPIYSYILSAITFFILLIACINFVNLTVAQSMRRRKEIGLRKVVGGNRTQLVWQFLGESFIVSFIAFLLALLIAQTVLPLFNELANKRLSLSYLLDLPMAASFIGLLAVTGFAAGVYPALVLSGFRPVETLRGNTWVAGKNYLSQGLVVLQFALATFLIIATLFIYLQYNYLTNAPLGYNDKNLLVVNANGQEDDQKLLNLFKVQFAGLPGVQKVAEKMNGRWGTGAKVEGKDIDIDYDAIDEDYLPTMEIPLLQGRNFSKDFPSDSTSSVIVNETFAKEAGWKDPVGKTIDFVNGKACKLAVIGVVKDYHFGSLKMNIKPKVFTMNPALGFGRFIIRLKPENQQATLQAIEKIYGSHVPGHPMEYYFQDEANRKNYEAESKWKQIIMYSTMLTVFLSCIGLLGLTMLSIRRRTKEIGIRKVFGANIWQVSVVVVKNFIELVFFSFLVAIPAGWWAASRWLENFPYRIAMNIWIFVAAALLTLITALLTVSFQSIKAAIANPVKSLRTE